MKVTTTILAILAVTTSVFAEAEPKRPRLGLCGFPGMTCHKAKRAAEAVSNALAMAEPKIKSNYGLCGFPGMTCAKARRSLSEIEDSLADTVDTVFERDADPEAEAKRPRLGLCGFPGMTCARSAAPEPKRPRLGLCGFPGMTCAKTKRGLDLIKEEDPAVFKDECFAEGGECHAVLAAQEAFHDVLKRDAEASPKFKWGPKYWHPKQRKGIKSYLSSCGFPGMTCSRDAHNFARDLSNGKVDVEAAEAECNAPGGDCEVVQKQLDELEATLAKAVQDVYNLD
jgi:hypothetical protein